MIKNCEGYRGQIRKGQNASFKFTNKNPHLTIGGAVSVGGVAEANRSKNDSDLRKE